MFGLRKRLIQTAITALFLFIYEIIGTQYWESWLIAEGYPVTPETMFAGYVFAAIFGVVFGVLFTLGLYGNKNKNQTHGENR